MDVLSEFMTGVRIHCDYEGQATCKDSEDSEARFEKEHIHCVTSKWSAKRRAHESKEASEHECPSDDFDCEMDPKVENIYG